MLASEAKSLMATFENQSLLFPSVKLLRTKVGAMNGRNNLGINLERCRQTISKVSIFTNVELQPSVKTKDVLGSLKVMVKELNFFYFISLSAVLGATIHAIDGLYS